MDRFIGILHIKQGYVVGLIDQNNVADQYTTMEQLVPFYCNFVYDTYQAARPMAQALAATFGVQFLEQGHDYQ